MKSPAFARVRKEVVAAVLVAAGSTSLAACASRDSNYHPAPNYTQPVARPTAPGQHACGATQQPTYVAPAPQYAAPAQPPAPSKGQFACGKGMCG